MTDTTYMARPKLRRRGLLYEILETVVLIVSIWALVDLASVRFYVDGHSMQPNFCSEQRVIVSRVNYMLGQPDRGEIIVFHRPDRPMEAPPLIKRVIGLPGETVKIEDTQIYIDDEPLYEPYINETCSATRCRDNIWDPLGQNEYFVMGDNRNNSTDSRVFGKISRENIIGEALVRYWPPDKWNLLHKIRYPENPFTTVPSSETNVPVCPPD